VLVALSQTQLATAVADRAGLSRNEAKLALAALGEVVLEELGNAERVRIGGLVQLTVRLKPAQKARKGRNPATGEEITIAGKRGPARAAARARRGAAISAEGTAATRGANLITAEADPGCRGEDRDRIWRNGCAVGEGSTNNAARDPARVRPSRTTDDCSAPDAVTVVPSGG
jgi:DNA-binding protein HU-beta